MWWVNNGKSKRYFVKNSYNIEFVSKMQQIGINKNM